MSHTNKRFSRNAQLATEESLSRIWGGYIENELMKLQFFFFIWYEMNVTDSNLGHSRGMTRWLCGKVLTYTKRDETWAPVNVVISFIEWSDIYMIHMWMKGSVDALCCFPRIHILWSLAPIDRNCCWCRLWKATFIAFALRKFKWRCIVSCFNFLFVAMTEAALQRPPLEGTLNVNKDLALCKNE